MCVYEEKLLALVVGGMEATPLSTGSLYPKFRVVVSNKSCMKPRLTNIQGDSNLFTDFFLR